MPKSIIDSMKGCAEDIRVQYFKPVLSRIISIYWHCIRFHHVCFFLTRMTFPNHILIEKTDLYILLCLIAEMRPCHVFFYHFKIQFNQFRAAVFGNFRPNFSNV